MCEMYLFVFLCCSFQSLQKNGQISSMTSLNGHSEDNTLAEGVYACVSVLLGVFIYSVCDFGSCFFGECG